MYANMSEIIDKYMICTLDEGEFNDKGDFIRIDDELPKLDGCVKRRLLNNSVPENGEIMASLNMSTKVSVFNKVIF